MPARIRDRRASRQCAGGGTRRRELQGQRRREQEQRAGQWQRGTKKRQEQLRAAEARSSSTTSPAEKGDRDLSEMGTHDQRGVVSRCESRHAEISVTAACEVIQWEKHSVASPLRMHCRGCCLLCMFSVACSSPVICA